MKLYAARDKDGALFLYNALPKKVGNIWVDDNDGYMMELDKQWFQSIRWEDEEPTEVTLVIINPKS